MKTKDFYAWQNKHVDEFSVDLREDEVLDLVIRICRDFKIKKPLRVIFIDSKCSQISYHLPRGYSKYSLQFGTYWDGTVPASVVCHEMAHAITKHCHTAQLAQTVLQLMDKYQLWERKFLTSTQLRELRNQQLEGLKPYTLRYYNGQNSNGLLAR